MSSFRLQHGEMLADRYRLDRLLGEGGIGTVWRAWQTGVDRHVAVKFLKATDDPSLHARFEVEAKALGRLSHPNCVTVFDFGYSDQHEAFFLAMEYLEGEPLSDWRSRQHPLADVVQVARQILTALAYAHHQGIVHRDLKPENIFLANSFGGERLVKVLDFGLAKIKGAPELTNANEVFGTPAYMSPEQVSGTRDVGPAGDLYSLGVVLYELIEGRLPFTGHTPMEVATHHMKTPAPPITRLDTPPVLKQLVADLLAKAQEERPANALEVYDILSLLEFDDPRHSTLRLVFVESPHESIASLNSVAGDTLPGKPLAPAHTANERAGAQTVAPSSSVPDEAAEGSTERAGSPWLLLGVIGALATLAIIALLVTGSPDDPHETTVGIPPVHASAAESSPPSSIQDGTGQTQRTSAALAGRIRSNAETVVNGRLEREREAVERQREAAPKAKKARPKAVNPTRKAREAEKPPTREPAPAALKESIMRKTSPREDR